MSKVRVLVGTKKGAFILNSDGTRKKWSVDGPFFGGWEMYHLKASPIDPNRIFASQTSGWFGQIIQRSDDGGKTWFQPGTPAGQPTTTPEGMPLGGLVLNRTHPPATTALSATRAEGAAEEVAEVAAPGAELQEVAAAVQPHEAGDGAVRAAVSLDRRPGDARDDPSPLGRRRGARVLAG